MKTHYAEVLVTMGVREATPGAARALLSCQPPVVSNVDGAEVVEVNIVKVQGEERPMQLVVLESPYAGVGVAELEINLAYARACMADCLRRGESPYASHLLYTQPGVLDDKDPEQRRLGIEAGFRWREETRCHTVVYCDLGLSTGMIRGILHALRLGLTVEMRLLPGWADLEEGP